MKKLILLAMTALVAVGCGDTEAEKAKKKGDNKVRSINSQLKWLDERGFFNDKNEIPAEIANDQAKLTEARDVIASLASNARELLKIDKRKDVSFKNSADRMAVTNAEIWARAMLVRVNARLTMLTVKNAQASADKATQIAEEVKKQVEAAKKKKEGETSEAEGMPVLEPANEPSLLEVQPVPAQ